MSRTARQALLIRSHDPTDATIDRFAEWIRSAHAGGADTWISIDATHAAKRRTAAWADGVDAAAPSAAGAPPPYARKRRRVEPRSAVRRVVERLASRHALLHGVHFRVHAYTEREMRDGVADGPEYFCVVFEQQTLLLLHRRDERLASGGGCCCECM